MIKRILAVAALGALAIGLVSVGSAQSKSRLTGDDYIEIQQLYSRYNMAIDTGDAEGWAATFTKDGVFNTSVGHDALVQFIHDWRDKMGGANRRHWNSNLAITPTPEGANGAVYLLLVDVGQKPPVIFTAATYSDTLVKTPEGWRFKTRKTKGEGPAPAAPAKP